MNILEEFSEWMNENTSLADSSIYKYTRAVNTISNEMLDKHVIYKSLFEMSCVELDIAVSNIFNNEAFVRKNTVGNNMYSNSLKQFRFFLRESVEDDTEEKKIEATILESPILTATEKQMLIKARIGQGTFRDGLIKKYEGRCVVTGIDKAKILIASHIKPWALCNNEERIDTENGLLLCPNMDKLFDYGLITFTDDGKLNISSFVGKQNIERLHISRDMIVDLKASKRLLDYMDYHRDTLFVK